MAKHHNAPKGSRQAKKEKKAAANKDAKSGVNKKGKQGHGEARVTTRRARRGGKFYDLSNIKDEEKEIKAQLAVMGLKLHVIEGDGNCLFRAMSDQLYGHDRFHGAIRKAICAHMLANEEHYMAWITDDESFTSYVRRMTRDKEYGTHLELTAFQRMTQRPIRIVQASFPLLIRDEDAQGNALRKASIGDSDDNKSGLPQDKNMAAPGEVLYLTYEGSCEHYSSVRNIQGPDYGLPMLKSSDKFLEAEMAKVALKSAETSEALSDAEESSSASVSATSLLAYRDRDTVSPDAASDGSDSTSSTNVLSGAETSTASVSGSSDDEATGDRTISDAGWREVASMRISNAKASPSSPTTSSQGSGSPPKSSFKARVDLKGKARASAHPYATTGRRGSSPDPADFKAAAHSNGIKA